MKTDWQKLLTRRNSLFMDTMKLTGASRLFLDLGFDYRIENYKIINSANFVKDDYFALSKKFGRYCSVHKKFPEQVLLLYKKNLNAWEKLWHKIGAIKAKDLSNKKISFLFSQYLHSLYQLMAFLYIPLFADGFFANKVEAIVSQRTKRGSQCFQKALLQLTAPRERIALQQE